MKKLFLLIAIGLFSSALFAQVSSPINIGVHVGMVSTKLDADLTGQSIKSDMKNGMMAGAFLRVNLNKWYIQPELNYVERKSVIFDSPDKDKHYEQDITLHSFDVPLLLGYQLVKTPAFKLRAFAGPVASFKLDHKVKIDYIGEPFDVVKANNFKPTVWNGKVGAGIDLWKLTLDVDYEFGLTDVSSEFLKKNKMFNVTLGFKIL